MGPFWVRIAVLCALFAVLRSFDANIAVSHAIRDFSHAVGERLGPFLIIAVVLVFGAAMAGLLLFRGRSLHPAVRGAALSIVLLVLLAAAQSTALYLPVLFLQTMIGPATVSRIIESVLLIVLAGCGLWFVRETGSGAARQPG
jgi:hypothetical protein